MDPRGQVDPEFTQSSHALSRPCSLARTPEFPAQWPQTHFLMICVDLCSSFVLLMLTLPSRYNHRSEMVPRDSCVTAVRMGLGWTGGSVLYPRSLWHAMTDTGQGEKGMDCGREASSPSGHIPGAWKKSMNLRILNLSPDLQWS